MPNIVIEEIVNNITLNIEEVVSTYTIEVSEMQVPGADGKSAYQSAIDGGFIGTELEFNEILASQSGVNTGDETASTIINKIGDGSKINQSYLPSYVDDILEFDTVLSFPLVGELGKIYIVTSGIDINKQYRWTGSTYNQITNGFIASTNDVPDSVNKRYQTDNQKLFNDATSSIQTQLNTKANDNSVVHLSGDETITGKKILTPNLTATANNQVLVGLDIAPTFTNGGFTGVSNISLRHSSDIIPNAQANLNLGSGAAGYGTINVSKIMAPSGYNIEIQPGGTSNVTLFRASRSGTEIARFFATTGNLLLQNGGTFTDLPSARLQINSTTQGFLPPRMTNAQRIAISSPSIGLCVYCTDTTEGLYVYKSTGWAILL